MKHVAKETKELQAFGTKIADITVEETSNKYFMIQITFPNGQWRRHFISYNALTESQEWNSQLEEELNQKKAR